MSLQDEYPWRDAPAPTLDERIKAAVCDGIHQAKQQLSGPLRDAMLRWGEPVLARQALRLARQGLSPDGTVGNPAWGVEAELAHRLAQGDSLESLQGLWELLPGIERGASEARWYFVHRGKRQDRRLSFMDDALPPLLLARILREDIALSADLLPELEAQQSWAELAWALVQLGQDPSHWLTPLDTLDEENLSTATARIAWACAALGGLPKNHLVDEKLRALFAACVAGLIWLAPAVSKDFNRSPENREIPQEFQTPWFLERRTFLRSALHLAHASETLGITLPAEWQELHEHSLPKALKRLFLALGITPRLRPVERRAFMTLCCPQSAVAFDWLDDICWRELVDVPTRVWDYQYMQFPEGGQQCGIEIFGLWLDRYLLPAIWRSDSVRLHRFLLVAPNMQTLPALLCSPSRLPEWLFLYKRELPRLTLEDAAQCWAGIALWVRRRMPGPEGQAIMNAGREALLAQHGEAAWQIARRMLIQKLELSYIDSDSEERSNAALALLRIVNLDKEEWAAGLAKLALTRGSLPTLLTLGAPANDVAQVFMRGITQYQHVDPDVQWMAQYLLGKIPVEVLAAGLFTQPSHFRVLAPQTWPFGPWLESTLMTHSKSAAAGWSSLVRHLALYSQDWQIRSDCARQMLQLEAEHAAN